MENNIETLIDRLETLKKERARISREIHEVEENIFRLKIKKQNGKKDVAF